MYDLIVNNWISIKFVIVLRGVLRVVSVKGQVFMFGCFEQDDSFEGKIFLWMYDIDRNEWKFCCKIFYVLGKFGFLFFVRILMD